MIRINLLGVERQKARKAIAFDIGQQVTLLCSLILVVAALGIGWWYWSLAQQAQQIDADIATAQQEATHLRSILTDVKQFEARRAQLQQRVGLIQQLRRGQSVPVQLLDAISRSVPDMLWLTDVDESGAAITIQGLSTTLVSVSDFVGNLGGTPLLKKPIDIVNTEVQAASAAAAAPGAAQPAVELIKFTIKAQLAEPSAPAVAATAPAGATAAAAPPR